ncbi:hypothetical protein ACYZT3_21180 [Pseudomonas sp. MDT1-16]
MSSDAKNSSLQELIDSKSCLTEYFYNDTLTPHSRQSAALSPARMEFTNWRDEQHGWRDTAIIFDQSHHMPELFLSGPDAFRLLNYLGINSFANLEPGRAKQFVACTSRGYVIGDCVLHCLAPDHFELISGMPVLDWVHFHAETGEYDVTVVRDNHTSANPNGRTNFRFGLDGPAAGEIFAEVVEGEVPEIPFFRTANVTIAGVPVMALRHGMAGHKGVELSGPFASGAKVRAAILAAGAKHGLVEGGTKAYFSTVFESGWMAYPLPAIYTDEELRSFREWLSATSWEASSQLGGSFYSENIEDYYTTPWDLGYERILNFDHDFIGREALEKMAGEKRRAKVTLVWNKEDVAKVFNSLLHEDTPFKYIDLPVSSYAFQQCDEVQNYQGQHIGLSNLCGYSGNEKEMLSLAMIATEYATPGTEVVLIWGEVGGGSRKSHVERHAQTTIRATVAPSPYAEAVRQMKRARI